LDSEERALRQRIRAKTTKNSQLRQASRRSQSANKRPAAAEAENKRGARNTGWDRLNQCDSRFRNSTAVFQKLLTVWGFPPPLIVYLRSLATVVKGSGSVMVIKSVGGRWLRKGLMVVKPKIAGTSEGERINCISKHQRGCLTLKQYATTSSSKCTYIRRCANETASLWQ